MEGRGKKEKICPRKVRAAPRRKEGDKTVGGKVKGGRRKRPTPCPPPNIMISLEKRTRVFNMCFGVPCYMHSHIN